LFQPFTKWLHKVLQWEPQILQSRRKCKGGCVNNKHLKYRKGVTRPSREPPADHQDPECREGITRLPRELPADHQAPKCCGWIARPPRELPADHQDPRCCGGITRPPRELPSDHQDPRCCGGITRPPRELPRDHQIKIGPLAVSPCRSTKPPGEGHL
jgi:hypothetical protein